MWPAWASQGSGCQRHELPYEGCPFTAKIWSFNGTNGISGPSYLAVLPTNLNGHGHQPCKSGRTSPSYPERRPWLSVRYSSSSSAAHTRRCTSHAICGKCEARLPLRIIYRQLICLSTWLRWRAVQSRRNLLLLAPPCITLLYPTSPTCCCRAAFIRCRS